MCAPFVVCRQEAMAGLGQDPSAIRVPPRRHLEYGRTPGNRGAWMLRRDDGDRTEFITLSMWESVDAIRAFAGDDIEAAVLYPEDERFLIDGESTVTHYDVVA